MKEAILGYFSYPLPVSLVSKAVMDRAGKLSQVLPEIPFVPVW